MQSWEWRIQMATKEVVENIDEVRSEVEALALTHKLALATRTGGATTEFKGKTSVQALLLLLFILKQFGIDIEASDEMLLGAGALMEVVYGGFRSWVKSRERH